MSRADRAVTHCGEPCGDLGKTVGRLRVPPAASAGRSRPLAACVDDPGAKICLPTGPDGELSTIHRATTTTQDRNKREAW